MVSNRTSSGFNTSLLYPHFASPMVESTLGTLNKVTFIADQDIGETFFNLMHSEGV